MKKIKQYEKRTSHIMAGIKNEADRAKIMMNHGKGAHHLPLNQPPFMMQHPSQLTGIMTMPPQSKHPMMGNLPQMSQMGQPNYPMVMGGQMPPFGIPQMGSGGPMPPNMGPMNMGKLPVNEMR